MERHSLPSNCHTSKLVKCARFIAATHQQARFHLPASPSPVGRHSPLSQCPVPAQCWHRTALQWTGTTVGRWAGLSSPCCTAVAAVNLRPVRHSSETGASYCVARRTGRLSDKQEPAPSHLVRPNHIFFRHLHLLVQIVVHVLEQFGALQAAHRSLHCNRLGGGSVVR